MKLDRKIWKPISVNELLELSNDQLGEVLTCCWNEGRYRYDDIGIRNIQIKKNSYEHYDFKTRSNKTTYYYIVRWSNNSGDPVVSVKNLSEPIDNIGDGEWDYGIYVKK